MTEFSRAADAPDVSPIVHHLRPLLAGALVLGSLAWAADLYRAVGLLFFTEQFLGAMYGVTLCLVFLHYPVRRGTRRTNLPWYDALLALIGLSAGFYLAVTYPELTNRVFARPPDVVALAVVFFVLTMEGLRRATGWTLVIVVAVFVAYALIGYLAPGQFETRELTTERLIVYLVLDGSALFGIAMTVGMTIVFAFVLFGQLLFRSGGSDVFNDFAIALMGRYRGGSAKIAVVGSSLFGTISGLAASNILATGVVTIPLMKRSGYPNHVAAAIEAVASTGGQIMPPVMGAVAFLMAELLAVPYSTIVLAALIPAILYYLALFIIVDLEAAKRGISRIEENLIPPLISALVVGWPFIVPFALLIYGLFGLHLEPQTAALYACLAVIVVGVVFGYRGRRMRLGAIWDGIVVTGTGALDILMIVAAAGFILGTLNVSGIGFILAAALVGLGAGNLALLLLIAAVLCVILGMGMPSIGVYVLLAVLIAPSLVEVGVQPIAAHMFIYYFGMMSFITPPVAIAAFFAANLAEAPPMQTGYTAMRLGWTAYIVPFLFVYSPSLLFIKANPVDLSIALVTAIIGVWLVSAAAVGFALRPIGAIQRVAFALAGLLLMIPASAAPWAVWSDIIGAILAAGLIAGQMRARLMTKRATAA